MKIPCSSIHPWFCQRHGSWLTAFMVAEGNDGCTVLVGDATRPMDGSQLFPQVVLDGTNWETSCNAKPTLQPNLWHWKIEIVFLAWFGDLKAMHNNYKKGRQQDLISTSSPKSGHFRYIFSGRFLWKINFFKTTISWILHKKNSNRWNNLSGFF